MPHAQRGHRSRRFSPAHAGNGIPGTEQRQALTVQPRTRRERVPNPPPPRLRTGSAPHTQGTGHRRSGQDGPPRFSPAHAGNGGGRSAGTSTPPVQPRTRRERALAGGPAVFVAGSAPHTQGTLLATVDRDAAERFSPAHAGNGPQPTAPRTTHAVQPRTRRERRRESRRHSISNGSAPHTQGTALTMAPSVAKTRFSPAHAGNGFRFWPGPQRFAVQPRTRRDRTIAPSWDTAMAGSAPHTQGTASGPRPKRSRARFSPAHAGNGAGMAKPLSTLAVQPRTRRERQCAASVTPEGAGSAPHTQGTGFGANASVYSLRFSPAHAGNGTATATRSLVHTVQPRTRRERERSDRLDRHRRGSAPHTQGTGAASGAWACGSRFSPAHAGNGCRGVRPRLRRAVQPRTRRERIHVLEELKPSDGSAPHTQGTADADDMPDDRARFSPAHAGNGIVPEWPQPGVAVQPRTRRERPWVACRWVLASGSAPHTQGTGRGGAQGGQRVRFSPAHAGNGAGYHPAALAVAVQPRTRRERAAEALARGQIDGSAPHTQGTGTGTQLSPTVYGSAPHTQGTVGWCL